MFNFICVQFLSFGVFHIACKIHSFHSVLQIGHAICEAGENDKKKRDRLTEMIGRLQEIVSLKDETKKREMVAHFLETEGTTTDLEEDCRERIADLQGRECVILVAGKSFLSKKVLAESIYDAIGISFLKRGKRSVCPKLILIKSH